jgi:hypothetical protein
MSAADIPPLVEFGAPGLEECWWDKGALRLSDMAVEPLLNCVFVLGEGVKMHLVLRMDVLGRIIDSCREMFSDEEEGS